MPFYNSGKSDILAGAVNLSADCAAGLIRAILVSASYNPDIDTHSRYTSVSAHEVNVTGPIAVGYFAGGQAISGATFAVDNTNDRATVDAPDHTYTSSTISARYIVILKVRNNGANKENDNLIGYHDLGSTFSSSNGNFTVQWNPIGIIAFT